MEQVLKTLFDIIIDDTIKTFYESVKNIIPNVFILKNQTTNYFEFINSITDSLALIQLKQIDLLGINSRLQTLLYYSSKVSTITYNQNLIMLYLMISTSKDIVIKNTSNGNKLLLLTIENLINSHEKQHQNEMIDIGIVKYSTQINIIQMNKTSGLLVINGLDVDILDIIKNILTN